MRRPPWPEILATHGVRPGPDGYDHGALEAVVAAHGCRFTVSESAPRGNGGFRALVFRSGTPGRNGVATDGIACRGRGPTAEAALAEAVACLLRRVGATEPHDAAP